MNQWQKGKFLYSFIYFIFSKNSAPIGGGGKQCECIRIRTCIHSYVDVCVCVECFLSMQRATTNMECFPLCGGVEKKGGMEDFLKERENSSVMNSRRDCLFHLPPLFFLSIMHFSFFFFSLCMGFCCCCYRVIHSGAILTFDPFCFLRVCSRSNFPPPKAPFWNNASLFLFFHIPLKATLIIIS